MATQDQPNINNVSWIIAHHQKNLVDRVWNFWNRGAEESYQIHLVELQRMRLQRLQCQLVKTAIGIHNQVPGGSQQQTPNRDFDAWSWESNLTTYSKRQFKLVS